MSQSIIDLLERLEKLTKERHMLKTPELTGPDLLYYEYLELTQQAKQIEERLKVLKEQIKERGTCSTQHYVCIVSDQSRTVGPNAGTLKSILGPDQYNELSSTVTYQIIKVEEKK